MKFIIDAQLPKSLSDFLKEKGFDALHTLDLPDKNRTKDSRIAKTANEEGRIVISKDADFLESFMIKSEPRKLILIKTGNIHNSQLLHLFEEHIVAITQMISRSNLVVVTRIELTEHE